MKRIIILLITGCLLWIGSFIWMIAVSVYGEGLSTTNPLSPEEAKRKDLYIRMLEPEPSELQFNDEYDLIIRQSWLEYLLYVEKQKYWIDTKPSDQVVLKVIYELRDRSSGEVVKDYTLPSPVFLDEFAGDSGMTRSRDNVVSRLVFGDINGEYKMIIHDGINPGVPVLFK